MKPIDIMICVNSPRNGTYTGRCAGIEICDFIDLDPRVLPEPPCVLRPEKFSIHRCHIPLIGHQSWVGNWCWDCIRVDPEDAALLISAVLSESYSSPTKYVSNSVCVWGFDSAHGDSGIALSRDRDHGEEITPARVLAAIYENAEEMEVLR